MAAGNTASSFVVKSQTLGEGWDNGTGMSYTPGTPTFGSSLTSYGPELGDGDTVEWDGTDGPILFADGSSLSSFPPTPVTLL